MDHASITRVAEAMISFLGSSAMIEARTRACEALDRGDMAAFKAWRSIMQSVRSTLPKRTR
jgi:hypothetical protein